MNALRRRRQEQEQVNRAIALSLAEQPPAPGSEPTPAVDIEAVGNDSLVDSDIEAPIAEEAVPPEVVGVELAGPTGSIMGAAETEGSVDEGAELVRTPSAAERALKLVSSALSVTSSLKKEFTCKICQTNDSLEEAFALPYDPAHLGPRVACRSHSRGDAHYLVHRCGHMWHCDCLHMYVRNKVESNQLSILCPDIDDDTPEVCHPFNSVLLAQDGYCKLVCGLTAVRR